MSGQGNDQHDATDHEGGEGDPDPSMEDILASIRRILSEDEKPAGEDVADESTGTEDDVFVLEPDMMLPSPPQRYDNTPQTKQAGTPPMSEAPAAFEAPVEFARPRAAAAAPEALLAPNAAASAASSVGTLVRTLASRGAQTHAGGPTIEEIVREEMRPLLKAWLDEHLPVLVERFVRAEIERVIARATP